MPQFKPSARSLSLGPKLKQLREHAHLTPDEACSRSGVSRPTLSRTESGTAPITPNTARKLLDAYDVPLPVREGLIALAKESGQRGWWRHYKDVLRGGYVNLEDEASTIETWELALIPGLLQTADYYRALLDATKTDGLTDAEIERRVQARLTRQAILTRPDAPAVHAILSEAVIAREVGGLQVMRSQLSALWEASTRPNITVQIMPFKRGAHTSMDGSFTLLRFDKYNTEIGYVEIPGGNVYLESTTDLEGINVRWKGLVKDSLSPSESEAMLQHYLR